MEARRVISLVILALFVIPALPALALDAAPSTPRPLGPSLQAALRVFPHAAPASGPAGFDSIPPDATPFPKLVAGGSYWFNNTNVTLTNAFSFFPSGVSLYFNNATVYFVQTTPTASAILMSSYHSNKIVLRDSKFLGAGGSAALIANDGAFDADRCVFAYVAVQLGGAQGNTVSAKHSTFTGTIAGYASDVAGAGASVTDSLIYNQTQPGGTSDNAPFVVGDSATVENDTFVNNDYAVDIQGDNAVVKSNTFRFNGVGVHYQGAATPTVEYNTFADNFIAGVLNDGTGATLDASNNFWDGTPGAGGDATGGAVTTSNAAAAPFPFVNDQTSLVPFRLHSLKSGVWDAGTTLDGPVIARSSVSVSGLSIDARGFRIGSNPQASLSIASSTILDAGLILSRGTDSFTSTTIRGSVSRASYGILARGAAPTITSDTFDGLAAGVVYFPLLATDAPVKLTIQGSTFHDVGTAFQGGLLQPTLKGNTVDDADIGFFTGFSQSPSFDTNRIEHVGTAYESALDQSPTWTNDATYESGVDIHIEGSTTPAISGLESRYNGVSLWVGGSQVTLSGSNVMDCAGICATARDEVISNPLTGQTSNLAGSITVAATAFLANPVRGSVTYAPPQRTTPASTSAAPIDATVTTVASGQTLALGNGKLSGPIIVRSGGALRILGADVDAQGHAILASPGSKVDIADAAIASPFTVGIRTSDARIDRSTFVGATYAGLTITEAAPASLTRDSFVSGLSGITLFDAPAAISRAWFSSTEGLVVYNATSPVAHFSVADSLFSTSANAVHAYAYPNGTIARSSFYKGFGIDDEAVAFDLPAGGETNHIDARGNWFNAGIFNGITNLDGSTTRAETIIPSLPRAATPWRAIMTATISPATTAQPEVFVEDSLNADAKILHRTWSYGDGTTEVDPSLTQHQYTTTGTFQVVLNVTDAYGKYSLAFANVTVKAAPVAVASVPTAATSLDTLAFDGSGSTDADGSVVAWRWQGSDGFDTGFTASPTATHAFARPGTMKVTLTAKDNDGFESVPVASFVDVADRAPVASFSASATGTRAAAIALHSTSSDADDGIATTVWDFGDGASGSGANATHQYATLGDFTITLTATDPAGNSSVASSVVSIVNAPPVVDYTTNASRGRPNVPLTFTSSAYDPDGTPVDLTWDFGDGSSATGSPVTHTFTSEATFTVRLTATDADGAAITTTHDLIVVNNIPPVASYAFTVFNDARVSFTDKSNDSDGRIVARAWDFGDGTTSALANPNHRFLDAGTHAVTLTVTDDLGGATSITKSVKVPDVLTATVGATLNATGPMQADLVGAWLNGTRVNATYTLRVAYFGPLSVTTLESWSYSGTLGPTGEARVSVASPTTGLVAPGRYQLMLDLSGKGYDGSTRTASATSIVTASAS